MAVAAVSAPAQKTLDAELMTMEKAAWDAFGKGDSKYFEGFLTDDSLVAMDNGFAAKADTIRGISGKPCTVNKYAFSNFKVTKLDTNTALVTYDSAQDGMCGTQAMPAKVYVSTIYVKRKGKWMGAFHQETPAM
jgi:hypothetical protein